MLDEKIQKKKMKGFRKEKAGKGLVYFAVNIVSSLPFHSFQHVTSD